MRSASADPSSADLSSVPTYGVTDYNLWRALLITGRRADLTAAPDALIDKLRSRGVHIAGETMAFGHIVGRIDDRERSLRVTGQVTFGTTVVAAALVSPHPLFPEPVDSDSGLLWRIMAVIAIVWAGCAAVAGWNVLRERRDYTPAEVKALKDAEVKWPLSARELGRYPNAEQLQAEWAAAKPRHTGCGAAALVWREPRLAAVAAGLVEDMHNTTVWRDDDIVNQLTREQIWVARHDINVRAHRIWRAHAEATGATNEQLRAAAGQAWSTIVDRVGQLADYRDQLVEIDKLTKEYKRLLAAAGTDGDRANKLLNALAEDTYTDARALAPAGNRSEDLELVRASLQAQIGYLANSPLLQRVSERTPWQ